MSTPPAEMQGWCLAAEVAHDSVLPQPAKAQNDAGLNGKGCAANLVVVFVTFGGF